jgi:sugar O-acyltransferase (sialic acid O-acetyltransferase NeuD family)
MAARRIVIVGAGVHGRVVRDVCAAAGLEIAGFLDDTLPPGAVVDGAVVLGGLERAGDPGLDAAYHVALGDNRARLRVAGAVERAGGELRSVIHPMCDVSPGAQLGPGSFVGSFSRLRPGARLGRCVLAEWNVSIGTDVVLGDGVFLGPAASLTSRARAGEGAFLGAGAIVAGAWTIGAWSVVAANATVLADVEERVLVAGSPARVRRRP